MRDLFRSSGSGPARRILGAAAVVCVLTMTARAELWSTVNLHPAGAIESFAWGVQDGQQVGTASPRNAPPPAGIRLTAPTRMVNTKTLTLKGELLDAIGNIDWRIWHQLGTVSATRVSTGLAVPLTVTVFERHTTGAGAGGPPTTDAIRFYNGIGSVSFTLDNGAAEPAGDIQVTVTVDGVSASKVVAVLDAATPGLFQDLTGSLSGYNLTWEPADGVIHLTGNVVVPSGRTLTILPGTLIMVDSGADGNGTRIFSTSSAIHAQGTQADPIYFFPTSGAAAMVLPQTGSEGSASGHNNPWSWGGFALTGSGSMTWSYVFMTGAGNGVVSGHPRPTVIRLADSYAFIATDSVLADSPGKIVYGHGNGVYTMQRCLFSRNGIGGEFIGSGYTLTLEDTWMTRIGRAPINPENRLDGDILHIDQPSSSHLRRCILTDGGDDVIDHSGGATPVIENSIIYDANDKVVSLGAGTGSITMTNCLVFNVPHGVTCTGAPAYLTHVTLGSGTNVNGQSCSSVIQQCLLWTNSARTCCGDVDYTFVGVAGDLGCGIGNQSIDPLFLDSSFSPPSDLAVDFNLQFGSPALTAGPTGNKIGWLGFPTADSCVTSADCQDGNPCTTDTCNETGQCEYTDNTFGCDDGDACTTSDACSAGNCVGGPPLNCEDDDLCTNDDCNPATGCTHTAVCCDDGDPCTDDTCNPITGCQHMAIGKGDMNDDGLHDGADVQRFVNALLTEEPTPIELCAADMNCDGVRTPDDVALFVGCLLTGQCSCP
jgi:hypothetical protein